jgi:hypothetical protein
MARLLVVSRSMALALRLADAHDVVEAAVEGLPDLLGDPGIHAIVLDVGEPAVAIQAVDRLRGAGDTTPLLIVSGYQPAWAGLAALDLPDVVVVPLPITRAALLEGIEQLVGPRLAGSARPMTSRLDRREADDAVVVDDMLGHVLPAEPIRLDERGRDVDGRPDDGPDDADPDQIPNLLRPFIAASPTSSPAPGTGPGWREPGFDWWNDEALQDPPIRPPMLPQPADAGPPVDFSPDPTAGPPVDFSADPDADLSVDLEIDLEADLETDPDGAPEPAPDDAPDDDAPDDDAPDDAPNADAGPDRDPDTAEIPTSLQPPRIPPRRPGGPAAPVTVTMPDPASSGAGSEAPTAPTPDEPPIRRLRRGWPPLDTLDGLDHPVLLPIHPDAADHRYPEDPDAPSVDEVFPTSAGHRAVAPLAPDLVAPTLTVPAAAPFPIPAGREAVSGSLPTQPEQIPAGSGTDPTEDGGSAEDGEWVDPSDPAPTGADLEQERLMTYRRALLGRGAPETEQLSGFRRRLGGRPYRTSLGPGGTSAELVALGHPEGLDQTDEIPLGQPARPNNTGWAQSPPEEASGSGRTSGASLPSPAERQIVGQLVGRLTDRIGDLVTVPDAAQVIAMTLADLVGAAASAVLVPDGAVWRVSGGVGLRPVERRLVLDRGHWLVEQVVDGGRPLLVETTDTVRQYLAGAPLASWRHLLVVAVPDPTVIFVLARGADAGPFTDADLHDLAGPLQHAAELVAVAVRTRHLARLLAPLRDVDPPH